MTSNTPWPDSPAGQKISATRCGVIVSGAGSGAAIENMAPVRSILVDGPGAWRISKFSTNRADTICIAARVPLALQRHTCSRTPAHAQVGSSSSTSLSNANLTRRLWRPLFSTLVITIGRD